MDFVYVCGDAYVDHPSFGCAIITRTLQAYGYSCAILAQPDWHHDEEFLQFGTPRLGFLVSAGNIDSMVNHYSVNKRRRDKDSYSDDGVMGRRPDRPKIVYTQILKRLFPQSPVLVGGIEASLRRLAHYDYCLLYTSYLETIKRLEQETGIFYSHTIRKQMNVGSIPYQRSSDGVPKKEFDAGGQLAKDKVQNVLDHSDLLLSYDIAAIGGHPGYVDADLLSLTTLSLERLRDAEMCMSCLLYTS